MALVERAVIREAHVLLELQTLLHTVAVGDLRLALADYLELDGVLNFKDLRLFGLELLLENLGVLLHRGGLVGGVLEALGVALRDVPVGLGVEGEAVGRSAVSLKLLLLVRSREGHGLLEGRLHFQF